MNKKIVLVGAVFFIFFIFLFLNSSIIGNVIFDTKGFEGQREEVLSKLYLSIEKAKQEGKYRCCIEPACTMCYLGHWIWKDGSCYCDDMIAKGEWDKVCPPCRSGIEKGLCKSTQTGNCPIYNKDE